MNEQVTSAEVNVMLRGGKARLRMNLNSCRPERAEKDFWGLSHHITLRLRDERREKRDEVRRSCLVLRDRNPCEAPWRCSTCAGFGLDDA